MVQVMIYTVNVCSSVETKCYSSNKTGNFFIPHNITGGKFSDKEHNSVNNINDNDNGVWK